MESSAFYTMKGYELAADAQITTAMEDYLEMICRLEEEEAGPVRIRALSQKLHVNAAYTANDFVVFCAGFFTVFLQAIGDVGSGFINIYMIK